MTYESLKLKYIAAKASQRAFYMKDVTCGKQEKIYCTICKVRWQRPIYRTAEEPEVRLHTKRLLSHLCN